MTEVSKPYYMYANGRVPYDRVTTNRKSVILQEAPAHELHSSVPHEYWRRSSMVHPSKNRSTIVVTEDPRRVSHRSRVKENVIVSDHSPIVREKRLYSAPPTRRRTRYLSESPQLSRSGVRIHDVHRPTVQTHRTTTVTTGAAPRVEYVPVGSHTRSVSTSHVNEVPIKSYRAQQLHSIAPPKPREIYKLINSSNPSRHSLPVTTEYEPIVVQSRKSVKSRPPDQNSSKIISIYHLDQPNNVTRSSPDVTMRHRCKHNSHTTIETKPTVSEVTIHRNSVAPTYSYPTQVRSVSALPVEVHKQNVPPYPVFHHHERRASTGRVTPYPTENGTVYSIQVPPRVVSDVSSVSTVKQFPRPTKMPSRNSNVYYMYSDHNYGTNQSSQVVNRGMMRPKVRTTIEHEIPLTPVVPITMWSEQTETKPASNTLHIYDVHENHSVNGIKHSKINQMGPPMLFSDLESDSDSSDSESHFYQENITDLSIKPAYKQYQYVTTSRPSHGPIEIHDDTYEQVQTFVPDGLVTLLDPNDPDGPKVTDQGPVYLYATRTKHHDYNSHYSD